jgi:hypothetical protein
MKTKISIVTIIFLMFFVFSACEDDAEKTETAETENPIKMKAEQFTPFTLTADISHLSDNQKQMLPLLFEASTVMDELFWIEAFGNKEELLQGVEDEYLKKFIEINYGPWERLNGNKPFMEGYGEKPKGAGFYPANDNILRIY